ncbi:MAG TPA: hypothetical protein VE078_02815 [Thermoanaerobaculia bacterium]|nr:hypothetical protein [Thermoanaerobaculia bacterium]
MTPPVQLHIEVPEDSPFFAGHFPGHPVLPGIAHLAFVARALGDGPIAEVRTLKLRRPVFPGDTLDLVLEEGEEGLVRFDLRRGEEAVSSGVVRRGGNGETYATDLFSPVPSRFPPPRDLVPHAPPALLVQSLVEVSATGATAIGTIPEDSPFADRGRVHAFVGLEAGAQAAAALEALDRRGREEAGPRIGYVVGIRNAWFGVSWLPTGQALPITVKPAGSAPPLTIYEVRLGGEPELLFGLVSTYLDPAP